MLKTLIGATLGTIVAFSGLVPAQAQWMIESGRTHNLQINAWGGAKEGTVLRLNNTCSNNNPDCMWTVLDNGMIVSDRDRNLAINAWGGAKVGAELHLTKTCKSNNPDCTWSLLDNNMIVSNRNRNLAINAWGGGRQGTVLRLSNACDPNNELADNPDCTWWWIGRYGANVEVVRPAAQGAVQLVHQHCGLLPCPASDRHLMDRLDHAPDAFLQWPICLRPSQPGLLEAIASHKTIPAGGFSAISRTSAQIGLVSHEIVDACPRDP